MVRRIAHFQRMLLTKEIDEVAEDIQREALERSYVKCLMPEIVGEKHFWRVLVEMFVIVLHRRGYLIVKQELLPERFMERQR